MYGAHIAISADRRWHWMYVEILLSYIRHSVRCNVAWPMRFKPAILGNSNLMPKNIGMHGKVVTVELTLYAALRKIRLQPIDEATQSCFLGKCDIIKYWIGPFIIVVRFAAMLHILHGAVLQNFTKTRYTNMNIKIFTSCPSCAAALSQNRTIIFSVEFFFIHCDGGECVHIIKSNHQFSWKWNKVPAFESITHTHPHIFPLSSDANAMKSHKNDTLLHIE